MINKDSDKLISIFTESIVRGIQRRKFLSRGIKGAFATVAGLALGNLTGIKNAFAVSCTCDWAFGGQCLGTGDVGQNCPSGCSTCTSSDNCNGWCNWSSGFWVSCTGLGACGYGYKICKDCKCPNCSDVCTVLSNIICYGCCTEKQVEEEMKRLAAGLSVA